MFINSIDLNSELPAEGNTWPTAATSPSKLSEADFSTLCKSLLSRVTKKHIGKVAELPTYCLNEDPDPSEYPEEIQLDPIVVQEVNKENVTQTEVSVNIDDEPAKIAPKRHSAGIAFIDLSAINSD